MKKRYPLEPLVTLRRDRVERRARELALAEQRAVAEKAARDEARQRRVAAETSVRTDAAGERARLEAGVERAHELTRAELHRVRGRMRIEALVLTERRTETQREAAEKALAEARLALGDARAGTRVIERHREGFRRSGERATQSAEEEAASDFHAVFSRRRPR
jgi:hypothetical protein